MEDKMANKRDYYEVLGVDKNATDDELKKAEKWQKNITQMQTQIIKKKRKRNSKK